MAMATDICWGGLFVLSEVFAVEPVILVLNGYCRIVEDN